MLDECNKPELLTPATLARIREFARTLSDIEIAALLHWPVLRLQRTATAHGIHLITAAVPRLTEPSPVEKPRCRTAGHSSGHRLKNGFKRGDSFSLALGIDADVVLRRQCKDRNLSLARGVTQLVRYVEENGLWDEVLE